MIAKCPHCQFAYTIMPEHIGLTSVCQNCHQNFVIAEDAPAAPKQAPFGVQAQAPYGGQAQGQYGGQGQGQYGGQGQAPYGGQGQAPYGGRAGARDDFAGPAAQDAAPPSGKLSRSMAKAQAKAKAKEEAEAKARAKAEAKARGKTEAAASGGGKGKLLGLLLVLVLLGGAAFYMMIHQPMADEVKRLTEANSSQTIQISRLTGQVNKLNQDQGQADELKVLHESLKNDIAYYAAEMSKNLGDSIYYQLAASVVAETRLLDVLVVERINALESKAKIEVTVPQSKPNEELAKTLEEQMALLSQHIAEAEKAVVPDDQSISGSTRMLALEMEKVTLATLRRNYYIAKYGLNAPYSLDPPGNAAQAAQPALPPQP
ncbi:MAG: zinc-ribbon domain-containing protein [Deltaproteobacteria bacterium]|jgi:hypothetical protein|nr:zinc-ribbon domain-containing protein [Deltaproteobacteria bacterium]